MCERWSRRLLLVEYRGEGPGLQSAYTPNEATGAVLSPLDPSERQ
jgi:hypothetical protein